MSVESRRPSLYELLPAYLRFRDQSEPLEGPLGALMAVLERQYEVLEGDIDGLYEDWFIETCQPRVAPFLGDLLGVRGLDRPEAWFPGQRSRIANTLEYRRRKGTLAVLERAVRDVTGWPCVAVPFLDKLSVVHSVTSSTATRGRTADLRAAEELARLGGPFASTARRPQISGVAGTAPAVSPQDGHNLGHVGLYLWRLQSYPVRNRTARKVERGCYTFHPARFDQPLFAPASGPRRHSEAMGERHVPTPLERDVLASELSARAAGRESLTDYLGGRPAFEILDPENGEPVPTKALGIADLTDWKRPVSVGRAEGARVLVDPELGRIVFLERRRAPGEVRVSYHYGAPGELGGGPYARSGTPVEGASRAAGRGSADDGESGAADATSPGARFDALQEALAAWPKGRESAVISITDSATYGGWEGLKLVIRLEAGRELTLSAAHGAAPTFIGDLSVEVGAGSPARLTLEGLTIGGTIRVLGEDAEGPSVSRLDLAISHCTVMPPPAKRGRATPAPSGLGLEDEEPPCRVAARIESSIVGSIELPPSAGGSVDLQDSLVDGSCVAGEVRLSRATLFGSVAATTLEAQDSIVVGPVLVEDGSTGYLRNSYVPLGSTTPERQSCAPPPAGGRAPAFSSRRFGQPGYGQLARACPPEILAGASNGSEMGAFCRLRNPYREANLAEILDEYLPWGLTARIFHVT